MGTETDYGQNKMASLLKMEQQIQQQMQNKAENKRANAQDKRMTELNDSYRKRYLDYIKIIMIAAIGLFFMWLFHVLEIKDILPDGLLELLTIISISVVGILIYILWIDIQKHDLLIYDNIHYSPPDTNTNANKMTTAPTTASPSSA